MGFSCVLFDLDDTLIKSHKVYDKALSFSARFLSEKYRIDHDAFYKAVLEKHTIVRRTFPSVHTRHSRILVFRMALDSFLESYDICLLPDIEDMYWDYFLKNIELYPNVIEILQQLRSMGVKTALVSDGDLSLRIRKAKAAGVISYIDEVVASEEVIFEKPFSAIFTLALTRLGKDAKEAIMIGNNFKNDIRGAQLVGIKAGIFDPVKDSSLEGQDGTIVPDFEIHDLLEIADIVKNGKLPGSK